MKRPRTWRVVRPLVDLLLLVRKRHAMFLRRHILLAVQQDARRLEKGRLAFINPLAHDKIEGRARRNVLDFNPLHVPPREQPLCSHVERQHAQGVQLLLRVDDKLIALHGRETVLAPKRQPLRCAFPALTQQAYRHASLLATPPTTADEQPHAVRHQATAFTIEHADLSQPCVRDIWRCVVIASNVVVRCVIIDAVVWLHEATRGVVSRGVEEVVRGVRLLQDVVQRHKTNVDPRRHLRRPRDRRVHCKTVLFDLRSVHTSDVTHLHLQKVLDGTDSELILEFPSKVVRRLRVLRVDRSSSPRRRHLRRVLGAAIRWDHSEPHVPPPHVVRHVRVRCVAVVVQRRIGRRREAHRAAESVVRQRIASAKLFERNVVVVTKVFVVVLATTLSIRCAARRGDVDAKVRELCVGRGVVKRRGVASCEEQVQRADGTGLQELYGHAADAHGGVVAAQRAMGNTHCVGPRRCEQLTAWKRRLVVHFEHTDRSDGVLVRVARSLLVLDVVREAGLDGVPRQHAGEHGARGGLGELLLQCPLEFLFTEHVNVRLEA
eukprot:PhM_4_TR14273/c1_g1_i1/m.4871